MPNAERKATDPRDPRLAVRVALALLCLTVSASAWLASVHVWFEPAAANFHQDTAIAPRAYELASYQLALWDDNASRQATQDQMRIANAEWDFMGRTFLVLALCNMALHEPHDQKRYLAIVDRIITETLAVESSQGQLHFLMPYATYGSFQNPSGRSIFVDGEIALMLAARQAVAPNGALAPELKRRIDALAAQLDAGPITCSESYPDECWMFCNSAAIAAIKLSDHVDGRDHRGLIARWLQSIREHLTDPATGLLVSSFTYDGRPLDGPEGTSIYFTAHMLQLIDPVFAQAQYDAARDELGDCFLGFGYAHEWPASWRGPADIDSGPIVPILDISTGASGMAILGAAAFDDDPTLTALLAMLEFAAFPVREDATRRYAASNQVGDAVLLYALVQGPLWQRVLDAPTTSERNHAMGVGHD
ncbi:MAG: hypothetical protein ACIAXF_04760 [Phycisphaerales bacterium JB063]